MQQDELLKLDRQLCFAVYAAGHAFTRFYKPRLDAIGLTYPQYLVMLVLWEEDGLTVKGLGEKLFLDSGTLTPLLKRMEGAGLLTRRRDREDERQVRIGLTAAGRELRGKAAGIPLQTADAVGLKGAEMDDVKADLVRLRDHLNAAIGDV